MTRRARDAEPRAPADLRKALSATPDGEDSVERSHADRAQ